MFFVIIALFLISAAVAMMIISATSVGKLEGEEVVSRIAESAAEDALIKLLRDPSFTSTNVSLPDGTASATLSGDVLTVNAISGKFTKKIIITTSFANAVLSVVSWREEF